MDFSLTEHLGGAFLRKRRAGKTESETLFEAYLAANGYKDWDFEPDIPGQSKPPDYRVPWEGGELFFEVKQLEHEYRDSREWPRKMIEKARLKFQALKAYCCSLVLRNTEANPPANLRPETIFAAMLGDPTIAGVCNATTGEVDPLTLRGVFGRHGKMMDDWTGEERNTTISAILVLENYHAQDPAHIRAFREELARRKAEKGQELDFAEAYEIASEVGERVPPKPHRVPRVIVHENPSKPRRPLPEELFTGPLDERWILIQGQGLVRTFVGQLLRQLEEAEARTDRPQVGGEG